MRSGVRFLSNLMRSKDRVESSPAVPSTRPSFQNWERSPRAFGISHPGRKRTRNEDAFGILEDRLFIVEDGMGGHRAGEVASAEALAVFRRFFSRDRLEGMKKGEGFVFEAFRKAVQQADETVGNLAQLDARYAGMGTTVLLAFLHETTLYTCHVGDSRAYVLDEEGLVQITEDHSEVWALYKAGKMTKEELRRSPLKNRITRAVGTGFAQPDCHRHELKEGDLILLCTDGLWDMLPEEDILALVREGGDVEQISRRLVDSANEAGGEDNITVIVMRP